MSQVIYDSLESSNELVTLADAIRAKTGDNNTMTVAEMAAAVAGITAGNSSLGDFELTPFYFTSRNTTGVTGAYIQSNGGFKSQDLGIAEGKPFILFIDYSDTGNNGNFTRALLYYNGTSPEILWQNSDGVSLSLSSNVTGVVYAEIIYNSETSTYWLKLTNKTSNSQSSSAKTIYLNQGSSCSLVPNSSYYTPTWLVTITLNSLITTPNKITINNLNQFNDNGRCNNIIDTLWDYLEYNIAVGYYSLENAFHRYFGTHKDWRSKTIQINTGSSSGANLSLMFDEASITYPPKFASTSGCIVGGTQTMFRGSKIKQIDNDTFNLTNFQSPIGNNAGLNNMFWECYYLVSIPNDFFADLMLGYTFRSANRGSRAITRGMFYHCTSLQSVYGAPYEGNHEVIINSNMFDETFYRCSGLKHFTFYKPNGSVGTMNAVNQTIDFSQGVGWDNDYMSSATMQLRTDDPDAYKLSFDTGYTAALLADTHAKMGQSVEYSVYNRQSAVETINSLPDTTTALTNNGSGTNTIKFSANAGSAGGNDYDMSQLSASEIAVATAKGWTVTLV